MASNADYAYSWLFRKTKKNYESSKKKKKKQEGIDITNFGYHVCCYWISVDSAQEWSVMESVSVS